MKSLMEVGFFINTKSMKKSIKLKYGSELEQMFKNPKELALLVQIAFMADEDSGIVTMKELKPNKDSLANLIHWNYVECDGAGNVCILNKKIVDVTLRKAPQKEILKSTLLSELKEEDVPEDEREYFKIAVGFAGMFASNLLKIGARTINIEKATYGKWVDPIRLMVENDSVTVEQLRDVWHFLKGHQFWSANVQSTLKLREKFQTIHTQLLRDGFKRDSKVNSARTTDSERKNYD